jgi:AcrR family transcriptional regulator
MSPKKKLSAAARRAQLVDVGRSVFAAGGYEATSVEEIAEKADISKPILYQHFGGKEGLYAVIVDREMDRVVSMISETIADGTPRDKVERSALAFLTYVRDYPDGFAVLAHDAPVGSREGSMASVLSEVAERVGVVFAKALKDAGANPKAAPIYAHALVGMVTFVGQWWKDVRKPSIEVVASHIAALSWSGLGHLPQKPQPIRNDIRKMVENVRSLGD